VHMTPPFSMHLVSLRLVPLGSFAFLAVGSALVDRPVFDNHGKISQFINHHV
jgi:hypothetical protein